MGELKIKVDSQTLTRLEKAEAASGLSADVLVRNAIDEMLNERDELSVAAKRWDEMRSGNAQHVDHDALMRKLGIED